MDLWIPQIVQNLCGYIATYLQASRLAKTWQKLLPFSGLHVGNAPPFHACAVTRGNEEEEDACTAVELL